MMNLYLKFGAALGASLLSLAGITSEARAGSPTAFQLVKEGNRYIGEQAKDKVVQIRSEKSIASLTPNIWFVVYYDSTAKFRATEVKFGAGKMLEVTRPMRLFERVAEEKQLDPAKLKIDSDKALSIAQKEPLLENLTMKASELKLEKGEEGAPVWKVRLWAAKLRKPSDMADIGEVIVSAETGTVLSADLKINRVD